MKKTARHQLKFFYRREIAILSAVVVATAIFVLGLLLYRYPVASWNDRLLAEHSYIVQQSFGGLRNDIARAVTDLAEDESLKSNLAEKNAINVLAALGQGNLKGAGALAVDADGVVIARAKSPASYGDNIFLTTNWASHAGSTQPTTWIESGKEVPLFVGGGQHVLQDGHVIGGVYVGVSLNDVYAETFRSDHLSNGTQVAFYSKDGVIGDSFEDPEIKNQLAAYFSNGSELVNRDESFKIKEVELGSEYYLVQKIVFPGFDGSRGGVLVFVPSLHAAQAVIFAALITLLFLLIESALNAVLHGSNSGKHVAFLVLTALLLFGTAYRFVDAWLVRDAISLARPPQTIYNSTLAFTPEADVVTTTAEKRVAITVATGGEAINAVEAVVRFDPAAVRVAEIIMTKSFCDPGLIIEKMIDNERGEVRIICGLPTPGFDKRTGIVAELALQPLRKGTIVLHFDPDTQVLANDGLGTNVLRQAIDGFYQVSDFENEKVVPVPIFSQTHPNSERWYQGKEARLAWPIVEGYAYAYALDRNPEFKGQTTVPVKVGKVLAAIESDGVWYFHLVQTKGRAVSVSHYKMLIDSTPPAAPMIQMSEQTVEPGGVVRMDFQSHDALSGLQSSYYVKIDNGTLLPVKPPFYVPLLEKRAYDITVRAFDQAGNYSETTSTFTAARK